MWKRTQFVDSGESHLPSHAITHNMQLFSKLVIRARMTVMRAAPHRGPGRCDGEFANHLCSERNASQASAYLGTSLQVVGYGLRVNRAAGEVGISTTPVCLPQYRGIHIPTVSTHQQVDMEERLSLSLEKGSSEG
jgi:hypothetical protein